MSQTITSAPNGNRIVRYFYDARRADEFVEISYARTRISMQIDYSARQEQYKIGLLEVTGYISARSSSELQIKISEANRGLVASRGRVQVIDNGILVIDMKPATTLGVQDIRDVAGSDSVSMLYQDIEHGPKPTHLVIDNFIGRTARIEWGIAVRAHTEDSAKFQNEGVSPLITSIDATVTYGLDQAGVTTRRVAGTITGRNVGSFRPYMRGFNLDPLARRLLVRRGFGPLMDAISLPKFFVRLVQDFVIDATENEMQFSIVDHEIYRRGLPPDVLIGDMSVHTSVEGFHGTQLILRNLSGEFQGHMDGDPGELLIRIFEIVRAVIDFDSATIPEFVPKLNVIIPNLYTRNAIAFDIQISSPVASAILDEKGMFRLTQADPSPGIPIAERFPHDTIGSANITGSAYNLRSRGRRSSIPVSIETIGDFPILPGAGDDIPGVKDTVAKTEIRNSVASNITLAAKQKRRVFTVSPVTPDSESGEPVIFTIGAETIDIEVRGMMIANFKETRTNLAGSSSTREIQRSFYNKLGSREARALGTTRMKRFRMTVLAGAFGRTRQAWLRGGYFLSLKGSVVRKIKIEFGEDLDAFIQWANSIDTLTDENDSVVKRLHDRVTTD